VKRAGSASMTRGATVAALFGAACGCGTPVKHSRQKTDKKSPYREDTGIPDYFCHAVLMALMRLMSAHVVPHFAYLIDAFLT
jgi:hypothetical protein